MRILVLLLVCGLFWVSQGQIVEDELCVACTELATPFFTFFNNSTDTNELLAFIDQTCSLFPTSILQILCTNSAEAIVNRLIDDSESFFSTYTPYSWCTTISLCPLPCCLTNSPEQVHISVTGDPTQMAVTWIQATNATGPYVEYVAVESQSSSYTNIQNEVSVETYTAGGWRGYIFKAVLYNLTPSTQYNYTVGSSQYGSLSPGFLFTTAPPSELFSNITFAAYGDMGDSTSAHQVMFLLRELITFKNVDLVLHAGDITYANGYQKIWDDWMREMTPIFAQTPYMAVEGNHESEHHFAAYNHRFRNPSEESNSDTTKYWSFNYGNVHFLSYSFEVLEGFDNNPHFGAQHAWIEQDLQKANQTRDVQPWIVVFGHRPFYCTYEDPNRCEYEAARYRHELENLWYDYRVDLVISGHNHNYERTYPVYKSEPTSTGYDNPAAPVYAVVGSAGRGLDYGFVNPAPSWSVSASRTANWGISIISTSGSSSLSFEWIDAYDSHIVDSFTITKS